MASQTRSVTLSSSFLGDSSTFLWNLDPPIYAYNAWCGIEGDLPTWSISGGTALADGSATLGEGDGCGSTPLVLSPGTPFDIPEGARITRVVITGGVAWGAPVDDKGVYFHVARLAATAPICTYLTGSVLGADSGGSLGNSVGRGDVISKLERDLFPNGAFSIGSAPHPLYYIPEPSVLPLSDSIIEGCPSADALSFVNSADFAVLVSGWGDGATLSNLSITVHYGETGPFWRHLSTKSEEVD